jgi:hypothetical protein
MPADEQTETVEQVKEVFDAARFPTVRTSLLPFLPGKVLVAIRLED